MRGYNTNKRTNFPWNCLVKMVIYLVSLLYKLYEQIYLRLSRCVTKTKFQTFKLSDSVKEKKIDVFRSSFYRKKKQRRGNDGFRTRRARTFLFCKGLFHWKILKSIENRIGAPRQRPGAMEATGGRCGLHVIQDLWFLGIVWWGINVYLVCGITQHLYIYFAVYICLWEFSCFYLLS